MTHAHDLLTRWPSLDVASKSARLEDTCHISPGPLASAIAAHADAAERAGARLSKRDPSVWSADPVVQEKIANLWLTRLLAV